MTSVNAATGRDWTIDGNNKTCGLLYGSYWLCLCRTWRLRISSRSTRSIANATAICLARCSRCRAARDLSWSSWAIASPTTPITPLRYADTEQSTWDSMAQKPQGSFSMRSNNCRPVTCIPLFVFALGVNDAIQTGGSDFKQSLGSLLQNLPDLR